MKKSVAIIISIMLIVALSVPAFAELTGTPPHPPVQLNEPITMEAE